MSWGLSRSVVAAGVVAVLLVAATACGSSKSSSDAAATTTTQAAKSELWANQVCTAIITWRTNVTKAVNSVKENRTKASLEAAGNHVKTWTQALAQTLQSLGWPQTSSTEQAKSTLATLRTQLQHGAATVRETTAGISGAKGSVEAVSVISSTLVTMRNQVKQAGTTLKSLPKGELRQAIDQSSSCQTLSSGSA